MFSYLTHLFLGSIRNLGKEIEKKEKYEEEDKFLIWIWISKYFFFFFFLYSAFFDWDEREKQETLLKCIKSENSKILVKEDEIKERWILYFEKLLNEK